MSTGPRSRAGNLVTALAFAVGVGVTALVGVAAVAHELGEAGWPLVTLASITVPDIGPLPTAAPVPNTNLNYKAKIELGRQLYFDGRLSKNGAIPCAFCHIPGAGFADPRQTSFGIDGKIGGLLKQAPPNDGVLGAIGKLGITPKAIAFDIETAADGTNTGWLVADGGLYKVDLASGKAAMVGKITGLTAPVRDAATLPAM